MVKSFLAPLFPFLFVFLFIGGCCLDSINLKPELSDVDLEAAQAGSASFQVALKFKDCCPTEEQKQLALKIQDAVQKEYEKVLNGKITLEEYNSHVKAANDALKNVILVCAVKPGEVKIAVDREQKLKEAWNGVAKSLESFSKP